MRIGDVARRAGVSAKAIRRYEELGLVAPRRLPNGYRTFSEDDVRAVRELRALRELGIPAERTRPFLECLASGAPDADDCPSSLAEYRAAIDELGARITELTDRRERLAARLTAAAYRTTRADPPSPAAPAAPARPVAVPAPVPGDLAGRLPGLRLPRLALPATDGGTVALDGLGPGRTVLYLYPLTGRPDADLPAGWDTIPGARGCTAEACGFRDHHDDLTAAGAAAVYGLSGQDTGYQREVTERLRLPFAMLSDPRLRLASALGLPTFEAGGQQLYVRITLIVRDGVVERVFHPVDAPGEHAGQVVRWLRSAGTRP
ncbi:MerR family transcriptional regulator [Streptomyces sp. NRRL F-5123]|uniref:MerR family transcriptional regulator n=1 Tax=Streptomyces sp. NRRL F-5123 TaxID=1463856 RepID=UPI0004E215B6|nr:MerR family transcriptional regulator [Streptomyces sp. NRRL F-5123]